MRRNRRIRNVEASRQYGEAVLMCGSPWRTRRMRVPLRQVWGRSAAEINRREQ